MESKFIEETNEKYSIREDSKIFVHYYYNWKKEKKYHGIPKEMKQYHRDNVSVVYLQLDNKSRITTTIQKCLLKYFSFRICSKCHSNQIVSNKIQFYCNDCKKQTIVKYKSKANLANKKYREKLGRVYVANTLMIKKEDMNDEMYELAKERVLLKRQIKKDYGLYKSSLIT